jgi:16S rRNA (guanine966-N2)-methyltransferase
MAGQFNLVFVDPPYGKGLAFKTMEFLASCHMLATDVTIIVEEQSNIILPENVAGFTLFDQRRYGEAGIWFYRQEGA